jgi:hypothetical protein
MLQRKPAARITLEGIGRHPWLQGEHAPDPVPPPRSPPAAEQPAKKPRALEKLTAGLGSLRMSQSSAAAGTRLSDLLGGVVDFDSAIQNGVFCGPPAAADCADEVPKMADALADALCDDDESLSAAHRLARDVYGSAGSAGPSFMPHASVVYGDLDDEEKAKRAASVAAELAPLLSSGEAAFTPTALALWRTRAGHTTEWSEVAEVPL